MSWITVYGLVLIILVAFIILFVIPMALYFFLYFFSENFRVAIVLSYMLFLGLPIFLKILFNGKEVLHKIL